MKAPVPKENLCALVHLHNKLMPFCRTLGPRFEVQHQAAQFQIGLRHEGLGKYSCKCAAIEWTLAVLLFGSRQHEAAFKLGVYECTCTRRWRQTKTFFLVFVSAPSLDYLLI